MLIDLPGPAEIGAMDADPVRRPFGPTDCGLVALLEYDDATCANDPAPLGWRVTLVFLWLPSPEMAVDRVAQRVAAGGHAVAEMIVCRYWTGLRNMHAYYLLASSG